MRIIQTCMDNIKECTIPECGSVPDLANCKVAVGSKQLRKALTNGRAKYVFLAKNADPGMTAPIAECCVTHGIPMKWCGTMQELGKACGIDVGASAAAVLDEIRF